MTNNATSETVKATGDARVAAQRAYDHSKITHTTHRDVAKSIYQVKNAGVQAQKASDDAKSDAHKTAPGVKAGAPAVGSAMNKK
jgi:hypothetical protein